MNRPSLRACWKGAVVVVLAALTFFLCWGGGDANSGTVSGVRMQLPDFIDGMMGQDQEISYAERTILPKDTEFARKVYHSPQGDRILSSIVLAGGDKRSIHRPEVCLPGQGWTIKGGEILPITLKDGRKIEVMCLTLEREVEMAKGQRKTIKSYYMYWFVGADSMTPRHWQRVFLTSWDRIMKNMNHRWAYVIVSSVVTKDLSYRGKDEQQTLDMLKKFIADTAPTFLKEEVHQR